MSLMSDLIVNLSARELYGVLVRVDDSFLRVMVTEPILFIRLNEAPVWLNLCLK
jgi:hypothetical protein